MGKNEKVRPALGRDGLFNLFTLARRVRDTEGESGGEENRTVF